MPVAGTVRAGSAVGVAVFYQDDRLALSRDTGRVERIQVVDGLGILRRDEVAVGAGFGWKSRVTATADSILPRRLVHGRRFEVIQGGNPLDDWRQRRRNLRIAHVGDMLLAVDVKLVDLCVEGLAELGRRTREVDQDLAGVDLVDGKAMRFEPSGDGADVFWRHSEPLSKFTGG